jgi:predicted MFS family arabinose efflux permease
VHRLAGKELTAASWSGNIIGALIGGMLLITSGTDVLFGSAAAPMLTTLAVFLLMERTTRIVIHQPAGG